MLAGGGSGKTNDGYIQEYNAQLAVDEAWQVIVAQHVTPTAADAQELQPAVDQMPIVLQEFVIGTLTLGDGIDQGFVERLRRLFDSEIVVTAGGSVLGSILPRPPASLAAVLDGRAAAGAVRRVGPRRCRSGGTSSWPRPSSWAPTRPGVP